MIKILIDTREQKPYPVPVSERRSLNVGDYTTDKLIGIYHIERKSAADLYGTITKGHMRFRRELQRAEDAGIELVVFVECSKEIFVSLEWSRRELKINPLTVEKIINTISTRYNLKFYWWKNRSESIRQLKIKLYEKEQKFDHRVTQRNKSRKR